MLELVYTQRFFYLSTYPSEKEVEKLKIGDTLLKVESIFTCAEVDYKSGLVNGTMKDIYCLYEGGVCIISFNNNPLNEGKDNIKIMNIEKLKYDDIATSNNQNVIDIFKVKNFIESFIDSEKMYLNTIGVRETLMKWLLIGSLILSAVYQAFLVKLNDIAAKWPLPENVRDVYDEAEYQKFINYRNDSKRVSTIKSIVTIVFELGFLFSNLYAVVFNLLPGTEIVKTLLLMVIFEAFSAIVSIPFDYYDTFVIEEKYGMNKSTKKTFVSDIIKEFIVGLIIMGILLAVAMLLFTKFGNLGILLAVLVIAVFITCINALSMKFMRIFNKFTPLEEGELRSKLQALCDKYGMQVKEISVMDASRRTTRANAFCAGIGNKKDIALDDNLVERYSADQIVAVFAHEFAHAKFKHLPKQLLINILRTSVYVVIVGVILNIPTLFTAFGFEGVNFYFVFTLFGMIAWPLNAVFGLVLNYFSRRCEYEADAFAAKEGYGDELISALKQLSRDSLSNLNPHPVIVSLEYSHPTISQRVKAISRNK